MAKLDPRRPVQCRGCAVVFPRDPVQPKRQYHTWECFKASRQTTATCHVCAKVFSCYVSEARKRETRGHVACCSRDCRNRHTSLLLGGSGEWVPGGQYKPSRDRPPAWRRARRAHLQSVGEGCGGAVAVEVHHLRPLSLGGEMCDFDNLMAVCRDCHGNMHEQLRAGAFACSFEEAS